MTVITEKRRADLDISEEGDCFGMYINQELVKCVYENEHNYTVVLLTTGQYAYITVHLDN